MTKKLILHNQQSYYSTHTSSRNGRQTHQWIPQGDWVVFNPFCPETMNMMLVVVENINTLCVSHTRGFFPPGSAGERTP